MARDLKISIGQHTDKGRKESNQDFHGAMMPPQPALGSKGVAVALADGISSSSVSRVASESAVKGFLTDYYCTSEAWSVRKAAERVLNATNSWLHSRTRQSEYRYDKDKGYVCAFSALEEVEQFSRAPLRKLHGKCLGQSAPRPERPLA